MMPCEILPAFTHLGDVSGSFLGHSQFPECIPREGARLMARYGRLLIVAIMLLGVGYTIVGVITEPAAIAFPPGS
jgi:hypothetical protein